MWPGSMVNKTMSSKLNRQIWPFLRLCLRNDRPRASRSEKHVNYFRWDLFRDAGKTTRSWTMNADRITIPRSKLRKYCHGQLGQLSRMSFRDFSCTITLTRTKLDPQCQTFKMADAGNHADASAFHQPELKYFQLLNGKESMQNIDMKIP